MLNVFAKLQDLSQVLDSFGGETRGIERVLGHERSKTASPVVISVLGLWLSGCGGLTSMSSYFLGALVFGLGLKDSLISGLVATILGCLVAAYCSTMGPRSGLRQLVTARYIFGGTFIRFVVVISVLGFVGWSVTNCVLGGQILLAVSNGKVPLEVGIVIINVISVVVSIFGITQVLRFELFISVPVFITVILLYIMGDNQYPYYTDTVSYGDEMTIRGNWLGFFALAYSVTATWGGCACDYYIQFPENFPQIWTFAITFFGISIPTIIGAIIGMYLGNATSSYQPWLDSYDANSLGGLLDTVFSRWGGGGKFLLMVFWLSLITNNVINNYSSALEAQLLGSWVFKRFPRWFLVCVAGGAVLICAMVGRNKFSTILSNFLPMLGYWISMYFTLLLEENLIFRSTRLINLYTVEFPNGISDDYAVEFAADAEKTSEEASELEPDSKKPVSVSKPYYNFEVWDDTSSLTHGYAAAFAFCCGVAGAVVGMAQVYYIGPISAKIGEYGGDLGMWLSMSFTGIAYPACRYLELKRFGR
ncbi:unnamed protein product [Kuraishia capsulata CBS 1993]|uniref:Uncharacterized protein n=1 Tax=Kuraishia capsulata CBS 1993 TaxID=1382522 RepID=W6MHS6_9ASCO|nr:uncharacterized protein KUCA_T00001860001 [Kuraishia capsulata CBS 1993]CDK25889.1 unnamed protein product [Kuraishia capsulata CBS 1993]